MTDVSKKERIAASLVASGNAYRLPLREIRCTQTIELKAVNTNWGRFYVTPDGDMRIGTTLRGSRRVSPGFRRMILGDET